MKIVLASPARAGAPSGNGATARRWRDLWRALGHDVRVTTSARVHGADLLVALHAIKCADAIDRFRQRAPDRPLVLAISGTDLNGRSKRRFALSLEAADHIVVLQPKARDALPMRYRAHTTVVYQSVDAIERRPPREDAFEIATVCGLRDVKDPLRAALAVRSLPTSSQIAVTHFGPPLDERLADRARTYSEASTRYEWHGAQSRARTHALLGSARALCITSKSEGGANVVSEAIAARCPVLASNIPGNLGILGDDWPATFPVGDTRALRDLMLRFEADRAFRDRVGTATRRLAKLVRPAAERAAWRRVFASLRRKRSPKPR